VDRCQRIGAHGEMISSDLHGVEEPIRWTLGWQRQDRAYQEPMHVEEEEPLIRTSFGMDHGYGDQPLTGGRGP
jgi:hypothetical protein